MCIRDSPWDGRTLEWSLSSPAPFYNFAHIPHVTRIDDYWYKKQHWKSEGKIHKPQHEEYVDIHMPRRTSIGFVISVFAAIFGFAMIWHMWLPALFSVVAIMATVFIKSFNLDTDYYVKASEVEAIEDEHFAEYKS